MKPITAFPARVGVVLGTRPEAIKLAPIIRALHAEPSLEPVLISTGQHREMLAPMLDLFGLTPDVDLDLMVAGQGLGAMTAAVLEQVEPALAALDLDLVVVQGDTTTAYASALAAFYQRIPVAHVEAGLRTGNPASPYPEEVNRRMISQIAAVHLAPTALTRDNLIREGIDPGTVWATGNTVIDSLFHVLRVPAALEPAESRLLEDIEATEGRVLLVTAHRRESWDGGLADVARALVSLTSRFDDLRIVFPIHRNPKVREAVLPVLGGHDRIRVTEPLGYAAFARVLARADLVVGDSGGIQEEACSLGKPMVVTRETTERPEALAAGSTMLVGTDPQRIVAEVGRLLSDPAAYQAMVCTSRPYGDGRAAGRIVDVLRTFLVPADIRSEVMKTSDRPRRAPLVGAAALVAGLATVSACSGGGSTAANAVASVGGNSSPSSSASAAAAPHTSAAHSPVIVASVDAGARSVQQVVMLHDLSVSTGRRGGIPAHQIPVSARALVTTLKSEVATATMLMPAAGSPGAELVQALRRYIVLGNELAGWNAASARPMSASYWATMRATDTRWLAALVALGKGSGRTLTANMAPLLYGR